MLETTTAQSSFSTDYRVSKDKTTKQSNLNTSPPHHCLGNACQLELFDISPPDYGELRTAIRDFRLTDAINAFLATGLATDDHDAILWLRAWEGKQEINGRWDCPRCHVPSREVSKKPKYITLECENCGQWLKWIGNHTIKGSLARLESPRHEQPKEQVTLNNLTDNRYLIGGEN